MNHKVIAILEEKDRITDLLNKIALRPFAFLSYFKIVRILNNTDNGERKAWLYKQLAVTLLASYHHYSNAWTLIAAKSCFKNAINYFHTYNHIYVNSKTLNYSVSCFGLAELYKKSGKTAQAIEYYFKAIEGLYDIDKSDPSRMIDKLKYCNLILSLDSKSLRASKIKDDVTEVLYKVEKLTSQQQEAFILAYYLNNDSNGVKVKEARKAIKALNETPNPSAHESLIKEALMNPLILESFLEIKSKETALINLVAINPPAPFPLANIKDFCFSMFKEIYENTTRDSTFSQVWLSDISVVDSIQLLRPIATVMFESGSRNMSIDEYIVFAFLDKGPYSFKPIFMADALEHRGILKLENGRYTMNPVLRDYLAGRYNDKDRHSASNSPEIP